MTAPDADRPQMRLETYERIMATIDERPLADEAQLNALVADFATPEPVDPWEVTVRFARSLGDSYELLWGDLGLLRPCLGIEHASAVLGGIEDDYVRYYPEPELAEVRTVMRLTALLQDSGKVLSVAATGENFQQTEYNKQVTANILRSISPDLLSEPAKRAVQLLVGQDVIGKLLQNIEGAEAELAAVREAWPPELAEYFDDLMAAAYLSDASAHSAYRLAMDTRSGWFRPAVQPEDAQLTFLFERHPSGRLTLTPDRAELVAQHFPGLRRFKHLMVPGLEPEVRPFPTPGEAFAEVMRRKFAAHVALQGAETSHAGESQLLGLDAAWRLAEHSSAKYILLSNRPPERTRAKRALGPLAVHVPEYNGQIQNTYHLRSGRVWYRRVNYGSGPEPRPAFYGPDIIPFPPDPADTHRDPAVEAALRRIDTATTIEDFEFGAPLPDARAWQVVRWIEASEP